MPKKNHLIIPQERIVNKIYFLRDQKVMLDFDLAEMYGTETKYLNRQVKRNIERFPDDFMFQLTKEEFKTWEEYILRCQNVTSNDALRSQNATSKKGGRRYMPYVFTEQGVAMLSSILKSDIAIQVNILIIRIFTKLREIISTNKKLNQRVEKLEKEQKVVFAAINQLMDAHKEEPIIIEGFKGK